MKSKIDGGIFPSVAYDGHGGSRVLRLNELGGHPVDDLVGNKPAVVLSAVSSHLCESEYGEC